MYEIKEMETPENEGGLKVGSAGFLLLHNLFLEFCLLSRGLAEIPKSLFFSFY